MSYKQATPIVVINMSASQKLLLLSLKINLLHNTLSFPKYSRHSSAKCISPLLRLTCLAADAVPPLLPLLDMTILWHYFEQVFRFLM